MSDEQDKAKLHTEINQYINQCFIFPMTAITVFGLIGSWILGGFISSTSGGCNASDGIGIFPAFVQLVE